MKPLSGAWPARDFAEGALSESRISSVVAASGLCRGLNFLVRWLVSRDTSLPVHVANVLSMLLLSYVSDTIRRIILYQSQSLSALMVNCLTLASVEVVSRILTYFGQIIMLGFRMQLEYPNAGRAGGLAHCSAAQR